MYRMQIMGAAGREPVVLLGGSKKAHYQAALALVARAGQYEKQLERGMPACNASSIEALVDIASIHGALRQEATYLEGAARRKIDHKVEIIRSQLLRPLAIAHVRNCMR